MTNEIKNRRALGGVVKSEGVEAEEIKEATLVAKLSVEENFAGLHILNEIPGVVEVYRPYGLESSVIVTTKGNISSLANAILGINSKEGVEIEKLMESSLNNGRPVKQLVMEKIKSNGGALKCAR